MFTAMLVWGMALLVNGRRAAWWGGAITLALSVLVRPSAVFLPVGLGISSMVVNRNRGGPYQSRWLPPVGAVMLILTALVLVPWAYRNSRVLGKWIWTTTNTGITAYDGFNPHATGASDQSFVKTMPQLRSMPEVERSRYLWDCAMQYITGAPAAGRVAGGGEDRTDLEPGAAERRVRRRSAIHHRRAGVHAAVFPAYSLRIMVRKPAHGCKGVPVITGDILYRRTCGIGGVASLSGSGRRADGSHSGFDAVQGKNRSIRRNRFKRSVSRHGAPPSARVCRSGCGRLYAQTAFQS